MNTLYPVFLKTENFKILVVGAGAVATEKLSFLLKSSPNANIIIVAPMIAPEVLQLIHSKSHIQVIQKSFEPDDIYGCSMVIAATNDSNLNKQVYEVAKANNILINVADTPELCDLYLGSIVTKGDLKIAISTNGKSPTMAKRIRAFFEDILPESLPELLRNMEKVRKSIKGDFHEKVKRLNDITEKWNEQ